MSWRLRASPGNWLAANAAKPQLTNGSGWATMSARRIGGAATPGSMGAPGCWHDEESAWKRASNQVGPLVRYGQGLYALARLSTLKIYGIFERPFKLLTECLAGACLCRLLWVLGRWLCGCLWPGFGSGFVILVGD